MARNYQLLGALSVLLAASLTALPLTAARAASGHSDQTAASATAARIAAYSQPRVGSTGGRGSTSENPYGYWEPTPPFYSTFFYMWYGNPSNPADGGQYKHWDESSVMNGRTYYHHPPANWYSHYLPDTQGNTGFDPSAQLYSSGSQATFDWQMSEMAKAHISVALASWWGPNDQWGIDANFRKIITDYMNQPSNPYPNLRWAIYYEPEGYGDPSVATIDAQLTYVRDNYANQPGYLWVNHKPVVFVYNAADNQTRNPLADLARWEQVRKNTGFYVSMKEDPLEYGANPATMDSWHEYAPAQRSGSVGSYSNFVSPGFWQEAQPVRLARAPGPFNTAVRQMVAANSAWRLVETWNEWQEGTAVEPGQAVNWASDPWSSPPPGASPAQATPVPGGDFNQTYVDILGQNFPPLENGTGRPGPAPPQAVSAAGGDRGSVLVRWRPGNGGQSVTSYRVVASPGGATITVPATATSAVLAGLSGHQLYTFTVWAIGPSGSSQASLPSAPARPIPVPQLTTGMALTQALGNTYAAWRAADGHTLLAQVYDNRLFGLGDLGGCAQSGPALAGSAARLMLAVRSCSGPLALRTWFAGRWGPWSGIPGAVSSGPALAADPDGSIYLAARTASGAAEMAHWVAGRLGPWVYEGGALATAPALTVNRFGTVFLLVQGTNGALYLRTRTGWLDLGGHMDAGPAATSDPQSGAVTVAVRAPGGGVWLRLANGHWETIGGRITGAPADVAPDPGQLVVGVRAPGGTPWLQTLRPPTPGRWGLA